MHPQQTGLLSKFAASVAHAHHTFDALPPSASGRIGFVINPAGKHMYTDEQPPRKLDLLYLLGEHHYLDRHKFGPWFAASTVRVPNLETWKTYIRDLHHNEALARAMVQVPATKVTVGVSIGSDFGVEEANVVCGDLIRVINHVVVLNVATDGFDFVDMSFNIRRS